MAKGDLSQQELAALGREMMAGDQRKPFSVAMPGMGGRPDAGTKAIPPDAIEWRSTDADLLQAVVLGAQMQARAKPKEPEPVVEEPPPKEKSEREVRAEIAANLEALGKRLDQYARKNGIDASTPAEQKILADARKRAASTLQARMTTIATQRLIDGKRELGLDELRDRARKEIAKDRR